MPQTNRYAAPVAILLGVSALAAFAPLNGDETAGPTASAITVIPGVAPATLQQETVSPLDPGEPAPASTPGVTLQDRVYFGSVWQMLDRSAATSNIRVAAGYKVKRVERTAEGNMFAGIVERQDRSGLVTDVVLSFAGAHGADAAQGEAILAGVPLDEAKRAAALYDSVVSDAAYAKARIHVTGHSLGAGYTQFVLAHALARYGSQEVDARSDFIAFGAPNWGAAAARHFGLDPSMLDGRFVDYTSANDPVLVNGVERIGTTYYLPPYDRIPAPTGLALNPVASHMPFTYIGALGLPHWLDAEQQEAVIREIQPHVKTPYDPSWGPVNMMPMVVDGDPADNRLTGLGGDDTLIGDGGADLLSGGGGSDRFRFNFVSDSGAEAGRSDRIEDFRQPDGDLIDLSRLSPAPFSLSPARFRFVGSAPFTAPRQVRAWQEGSMTWVAANVDGDLAPDLLVGLVGRIRLSEADFIF